jgi:hypothetical protein
MKPKVIKLMIGMIAVILLSGCASNRLENDFGTSYKLALMNQELNPEAEKNLKPVEGIDEQAGQKILEKYHTGFDKQVQPMPVFSFGISGGAR